MDKISKKIPPFFRFLSNIFNFAKNTVMEIRVKVNDDFMEELKKDSGITNTSQLLTEAFTLLKWAVSESQKGRVIISENEVGEDEKELVMPSLQYAKRMATPN